MTSQLWSNIVRGVALGDAWGDPAEFQSIQGLTRDNPQGPEMPSHLRITDDTQMTLYLGAALDETWGADMATVKKTIMDRFLDYRDDPDNNRAPGATVMGSLGALSRRPGGYDWKWATSKSSDGSGTVMRTSPCAFLPENTWVGVTAFAAAVTHGTANGIAAAILNVAVLRALMEGNVKAGGLVPWAQATAEQAQQAGLTDTGEWLEGFMDAERLNEGFVELARLLAGTAEVLDQLTDPWALTSDPSHWVQMGGGWRGHETLVIALAAVDMFPEDPMGALRRSVTTDGDSDTIGAVAGGLVGAAFPTFFTKLWDEGLALRFEKRYRNWIEVESDDYPFEDPKPALQWVNSTPKRAGYWRRLVGLK